MYIVFDTSVIIAAALKPDGLCSKLIDASGSEFLICTSEAILSEFISKMDEKGTDQGEINHFIEVFRTGSVLCDRSSYTDSEIINDDHIIGCYKTCKADLIVSLDKVFLKKLMATNIPGAHPSDLPHYYE